MREIKFRAWAEHTVNNRWNYAYENAKEEIDELKRIGEDFDEQDIRHKYAQEWMKTHTEDEVYTKTLEMITDIKVNVEVQRPYGYEVLAIMQYTGLHDKNGKEIYEGDIVREYDEIYSLDVTPEVLGTYAVKYDHNGFWLDDRDNENGFGDKDCMEVIGNIYENPELINTPPIASTPA